MTDARQRRLWHRTGSLDAKPKGIRYLTGSVLAFGGLLAAATNQGCGPGSGTTSMTTQSTSSSGPTTTSTTTSSSGMGGGMPGCNMGPFTGQLAPGANGGFSDAFDAVPDSNGSAVYFTAINMAGDPGVFKQDICAAASGATEIYTGGLLEAPFNIAISTDDKTLFIADTSAAEDPTDPTKDKGILFSLSTTGGLAPSVLVGSVAPRGLTVVSENSVDQVYFTGIDKANKLAGVFKVAATGGTVTTVAEGPPFSDPSGLTVASNGDIYVADTDGSGSRLGNVILVHQGMAAEFVADLQVGYPAGIAIMKDDSTLLVSGLDNGAVADAVIEITIATKAVSMQTFGNTIDAYAEAAGLHRARGVDVFAWADSKATPAGKTGTGTVFVIK